MVILSSSSSNSPASLSLPSPARGSPPGISPNKSSNGVTPELSGLELMLNSWRRQAERKTQEFRQREIDGQSKREQDQKEVDKLRNRVIESRLKKLEQQSKNSKNNGGLLSSDLTESGRKRRSDDDYYSGTPSDGGFDVDGDGDTYSIESGQCPPKVPKCSTANEKIATGEKSGSSKTNVFIETFHLPPTATTMSHRNEYNYVESMTTRPNLPASMCNQTTLNQISTGSLNTPIPTYSSDFDFGSPPSLIPSSSCNQQLQQRRVMEHHPSTEMCKNQIADVASSTEFDELILSHPIDLDILSSADLLQAVDDLDRSTGLLPATRQVNSQSKSVPRNRPTFATQQATNAVPDLQLSSLTRVAANQLNSRPVSNERNNVQPPPPPSYALQQQYSVSLHQSQPQQPYHQRQQQQILPGSNWHNQQPQNHYPTAPHVPSAYSNSAGLYPMNGGYHGMNGITQLQQRMACGWPQVGNPAENGQRY